MSKEPIDLLRPTATILIVDGQLYYQTHNEGGTNTKAISYRDVRSAFSGVDFDTGWLHYSVRRTGENAQGPWYISLQEPEMQKINLGGDCRVIEVPLPPALFAGFGNHHYVWALPDHTVINEGTELFYMPLPNVYGDGKICWGQNERPSSSAEHALGGWKMFLSAEFGTSLIEDKSKAHPRSVRQQLIDISKQGLKQYPMEDLVPLGYPRLGRWAEQCIKGE